MGAMRRWLQQPTRYSVPTVDTSGRPQVAPTVHCSASSALSASKLSQSASPPALPEGEPGLPAFHYSLFTIHYPLRLGTMFGGSEAPACNFFQIQKVVKKRPDGNGILQCRSHSVSGVYGILKTAKDISSSPRSRPRPSCSYRSSQRTWTDRWSSRRHSHR